MRIDTLENKEELLRLLYPSIVDWAIQFDYSIPSMTELKKYTFEMAHCDTYPTFYNGVPVNALGTHYTGQYRIRAAMHHAVTEVVSTLVHELAHAVQYFSLGDDFGTAYRNESTAKAHSINRFEDEARALEKLVIRRRFSDKDFNHAVISFHFKMAKPAPKPKVKERAFYHVYGEYYGHYGMHPERRTNRKQWWLYR